MKDQEFEAINVDDHLVPIYRLQWWELYLFICYYVICAIIVISGQLMIIFFIKRYAPKERPINRMILVDQVRTITWNLISIWHEIILIIFTDFSSFSQYFIGPNCIFVICQRNTDKWNLWEYNVLDSCHRILLSRYQNSSWWILHGNLSIHLHQKARHIFICILEANHS